MARKIVGLRLSSRGWRGGVSGVYLPDSDGKSLQGAALKRVLSGEDAVPGGTHVHYDFDPIDEDGLEVGPGDPRLEGFYADTVVEAPDESIVTLHQTGDETHRADGRDDHGCTPVAKVERSVEGRFSFRVRGQAVVGGVPVGEPTEWSASVTVA